MKNKSQPVIKVFITKSKKFRARIRECEGEDFYEVKVGGEAWLSGKGRKFEKIIIRKCNILLSDIEKELIKINT